MTRSFPNDDDYGSDRIKLDLPLNVSRLQAELKVLQSGDWIDHFVTQNYHGHWSVIPLRASATATHPVQMIYSDPTCTEFVDTPFLDRCPYFRHVLAMMQCPLQAVRLMKLTPGSYIKEHTDYDLAAEGGVARLHIPVVTNSDVDFRLNGRRLLLQEGECWYLRLSDPHSVANRGTSDRIHLVIDAEVKGGLGAQLLTKLGVIPVHQSSN